MILKIAAFALLIGCASNVEPGLLTHTIRRNDDRRAYAACMQQRIRNTAEQKYVCLRWSRVRWAGWAWEDCVNDGTRICGHRPRYDEVP